MIRQVFRMSEFGTFLENHMDQQEITTVKLAADMGIDPTLISGFTNNRRLSCNVETLMKMVKGISQDEKVRAGLLEAYFRDQCLEAYKDWINVDPANGPDPRPIKRVMDGEDHALDDLVYELQLLRLPNAVLRALRDIARRVPEQPTFRVVVENMAELAREITPLAEEPEPDTTELLPPKPVNYRHSKKKAK